MLLQCITFKFVICIFYKMCRALHKHKHIYSWLFSALYFLVRARSVHQSRCGLFNPSLLHFKANKSIPSLYLWLNRRGQGSISSDPWDTLRYWMKTPRRVTPIPMRISGFDQLSDRLIEPFCQSVDGWPGNSASASHRRQCRSASCLSTHHAGIASAQRKSNYWTELVMTAN